MILNNEETGKIPTNLDAEERVLATCLRDGNSDFYDSIATKLEAEDFYLYKHQLIYKSIASIALNGQELSEITLIEELKKKSELDEVGSALDIVELMDKAASPLQSLSLVNIIKEKSNLRRLIRTCKVALENAEDECKSPDDIRSSIEDGLMSIELGSSQDMSLKNSVELLEEEIESQLDGTYKEESIKTHIDHLDERLGANGVGLGEVVVISAPTSCGKSQLALNIVTRAAMKDNISCGIFSLEMPQKQVAKRMLTIKSQANLKQIKDRVINDKAMSRVREGCEQLKEFPLYSIHHVKNVSELCSYARTMVRRHGVKLLVIDYLQLIPWENKNMSKNDAVADISHRIKQLALELNIGILLLSQVNREGAKREGGLAIYDLKDSGDIENDADVIILMWPANNDIEASKNVDSNGAFINMKYNIAKNREGERDIKGNFKFYHTKGLFY